MRPYLFVFILLSSVSCKKNQNECSTTNTVNLDLLPSSIDHTTDGFNTVYSENLTSVSREITTDQIPDHNYGVTGMNAVTKTFEMTLYPTQNSTPTPIADNTGINWIFGIALNGVTLSPGVPMPYTNTANGSKNWNWTLEGTFNTKTLGLDDNYAHMKDSTGGYHYHGDFINYASALGADGSSMVLCGWAADGFPIYYRYAYSNADNIASPVEEMTSSYLQKTGVRPGDGESAPCNKYNGVFTQDFEYIEGQGDLDECNGRYGKTPEFLGGTYYYVITRDFPMIPRMFKGTPNISFSY
ncbi:MAG: YHYH protein [Crocinitomicaceae bacterium]